MTVNAKYVELPKLEFHGELIDAYTKPYTLSEHLPEDVDEKYQDDKTDTLNLRKEVVLYLLDNLIDGHKVQVWGALIEIADADPIAGFYITLDIRRRVEDQGIKNDLVSFMYFLVDKHEVLQNSEEILFILFAMEHDDTQSSIIQEEYYDEPYSEIGEIAIFKAKDEHNYIDALFLVNKITDDEVHNIYLNRLSTLFGDRAMELASTGDIIAAYRLISLIPIDSIKSIYMDMLG